MDLAQAGRSTLESHLSHHIPRSRRSMAVQHRSEVFGDRPAKRPAPFALHVGCQKRLDDGHHCTLIVLLGRASYFEGGRGSQPPHAKRMIIDHWIRTAGSSRTTLSLYPQTSPYVMNPNMNLKRTLTPKARLGISYHTRPSVEMDPELKQILRFRSGFGATVYRKTAPFMQ